jgi:hypothetical protein
MRSGKGRERSSERSGARKPGDLVLSSDAVLAVLTEAAGSKKVEAALAGSRITTVARGSMALGMSRCWM